MAVMIPYPFPVKGQHTGFGFDASPEGTSPDCLNVVAYDVLRNRLRGGRRPGLSKYMADQIHGDDPVQGLWRVGTASTPTGGLEQVTDDFSSASYGITGIGNIGDDWLRGIQLDNNSADPVYSEISFDGTNDWMTFNRIANGGGQPIFDLMMVAFDTTNDVTSTCRANGQATTANSNDGAADEPTWCGPCIRVTDTYTSGVGARIIRSGPNQVQLQLFSFLFNAVTPLATSPSRTLSGTAVVTADVEIRLFEEAGTGTLTAILDIPSQGIDSLSVSAVSSTNAGEKRAGFATFQQNQGAVADWRKLKSVTYTKVVPAAPVVSNTLLGTAANPLNADRYYVPDGWTALELNTSTNAATLTPGFASSAADPSYPAIDDTSNVIWDAAVIVADRVRGIYPTTADDSTEVEIQTGTTTANTGAAAGFLWSDDGKSGIVAEAILSSNANEENAQNGNLTTFRVIIISGGAVASTRTIFSGVSAARPIRYGPTARIKVRYTPSTFGLSIEQNGIVHASATLSGSEQTAVTAFTGTRSVLVTMSSSTNVYVAGFLEGRFVDSSGIAPNTVDVRIVGAAGGTVAGVTTSGVVPITNGELALSPGLFSVQGTEAYGKVFFVDGLVNKYYDKFSNTILDWAATEGSLPVGATLIALFRGRIVLSGVATDAHNYFMSKVGDPFNYDYSPATTTETDAVAGNNSNLGLVGDVITSLIPFGDDYLLFGGDHTIWLMEGDPAAGGSLVMVSDQTGMANGNCWCKDPNGVLYFWGTNGIYHYVIGGKPENITRGHLNNRFENLNRANNVVRMAWDFLNQGLVVQIINVLSTVANTTFFYNPELDAWFPWEYPASMGPSSLLTFDGPLPSDQAMLYGCKDGYVRRIDATAENDDGTPIQAEVSWPVMIAQDHASEIKLEEIIPVLAATSGSVRVSVYSGQTAEGCALSTQARVSKMLRHAGRNSSLRQKVRGYALRVKVSGTSRWAMEGLSMGFDPAGKPHQQKSSRDGE